MMYYVRLVQGDGYVVGDVAAMQEPLATQCPQVWAPCDPFGWVDGATQWPVGVRVEYRGSRQAGKPPTDWRPVPPTTRNRDLPAHECAAHARLTPHVRLVAGDGYAVGDVAVNLPPEPLREPPVWAPCDVDGWVSAAIGFIPAGLKVEFRGSRDEGANPTDWRPARVPQFSSIDEMAEKMKGWAAPTRSRDTDHELPTRECAAPGYTGPFRYEQDALKPTNPKDAAATDRVPLGLLSPIAKAHWALAQHCGRAKYGAWNWREAGVRVSIYVDAIGRHIDGYLSGETYDPQDNTHHLGNIMACCAILLEAEAAGKLVDDRPPTLDMRPTYAEVQRRLADLTIKYADRNPKHWTAAR